MRILGLDPGIATVGFGVIRSERGKNEALSFGAITTPANTPLSERLDTIFRDCASLIEAFEPDAVSIEELFFKTNITTGIAVAHGRGVLLLCCRRHGVPIYEYTPPQVKQSVVGYGKAEKKQVMEMVRRLLGLEEVPRPDDAADALALALCHARAASSLLSASWGDKDHATT